MYTTYILQNSITKRYYIGNTKDLIRRLNEHDRGQSKYTRQKGNWKLIYKEEFEVKLDSFRRETKIKSYKGGNAFKKLIADVVQQ